MFVKKEEWNELKQRLADSVNELEEFKNKTKLKLSNYQDVYNKKLESAKEEVKYHLVPDKFKIIIHYHNETNGYPKEVIFDTKDEFELTIKKTSEDLLSNREFVRVGNGLVASREIKNIEYVKAKHPQEYTESEINDLINQRTNELMNSVAIYTPDSVKVVSTLLGRKCVYDELWNK
jgi:hypothetical protein